MHFAHFPTHLGSLLPWRLVPSIASNEKTPQVVTAFSSEKWTGDIGDGA